MNEYSPVDATRQTHTGVGAHDHPLPVSFLPPRFSHSQPFSFLLYTTFAIFVNYTLLHPSSSSYVPSSPFESLFLQYLPSSSLTLLSFRLLLGVRIYIYLSSFFSRVHLSSLTSAGYIYLSSLLHRLKMIARESVRGPSWIDADIDQTIPSFGRLVHSCLSHTFQPCSLSG